MKAKITKKPFIRQKNNFLFDETNNSSSHLGCYDARFRTFSKKLREKYLADLGSGSETEYQSASALAWNAEKSQRFLEWLITCCNAEDSYLDSSLCWGFMAFTDNPKTLPAVVKSARKCPADQLWNYPQLLASLDSEETKTILKEKFLDLKDHPKTFKKMKDRNDFAFNLISVCENLLRLEPNNTEVADCLVKLSKHPNWFQRECAVRSVAGFYKASLYGFGGGKSTLIFYKRLKELTKINDVGLFTASIQHQFMFSPLKAYEKFKKFYLASEKVKRSNLASNLFSVENPFFWIVKLVKELPVEDAQPFQDYLNWHNIRPVSDEEILDFVREDFNAESPNKRISAIGKLDRLNPQDAKEILLEAIADEPDNFIRKRFERELKKISNNKIPPK